MKSQVTRNKIGLSKSFSVNYVNDKSQEYLHVAIFNLVKSNTSIELLDSVKC